MDLLPKNLTEEIPKLYETDTIDIHDKIAHIKLFVPGTYWTWYIVEYDDEDLCFGLVEGHEVEFGYFSIKELKGLKNPLPVERDLHFKPMAVSKLLLQGMSRRG